MDLLDTLKALLKQDEGRLKLSDIRKQLRAWFPPEQHEERKLPGGGKWFFVPWQFIRDRFDEICPDDWEVKYSDPIVTARGEEEGTGNGLVVIRCVLTVCGVTREGVGNSDNDVYLDVTESYGKVKKEKKYKGYGTPVERATADAFKNAAENFGVCAYLDAQKDKANISRFVKHMQGAGRGEAYQMAFDNGWVEMEDGTPANERARDKIPVRSEPRLIDALSADPPKAAPKKQIKVQQKPAATQEQPVQEQPGLYPRHGIMFDDACEAFPSKDIKQRVLKWIAQAYPGKTRPDQLVENELVPAIELIVCAWAVAEDAFSSISDARSSLRANVALRNPDSVWGYSQTVNAWANHVIDTLLTDERPQVEKPILELVPTGAKQ